MMNIILYTARSAHLLYITLNVHIFSAAHLPARPQPGVCRAASPSSWVGAAPAQAPGHHRHRPVQDAEVCGAEGEPQPVLLYCTVLYCTVLYYTVQVSHNQLQHYKMFGTQIPREGPMKDVCSGDSGRQLSTVTNIGCNRYSPYFQAVL